MRVLAAMSGGVDSAVAAARAVDAGHDVTGVHLALSKNPESYRSGARGCCSKEDAHDARRAADVLGIPFYVWDLSDRFAADVVDDFVAAYAAGADPESLPALQREDQVRRGAATGRWRSASTRSARATTPGCERGDQGVELHRAVDLAKDQSYVLGVLTAAQLERSLFPLGGSTKTEVRAEAARRGLAVAEKPDSHDICFIPDGDTAGFLERRLGARPGAIVDEDGSEVGEHRGTHAFTVGQRRGLRLGVPADDGQPRFVLDISPVTNTVTVGPRSLARGATDHRSTVRSGPVRDPPAARRCLAQVRAHGEPMPAELIPPPRTPRTRRCR